MIFVFGGAAVEAEGGSIAAVEAEEVALVLGGGGVAAARGEEFRRLQQRLQPRRN